MLAYQKGTLISWNDDRGFGFIEPENKAQKVFLHISALKKGGRRPQQGDIIRYQLDIDHKDRIQAINASILGVNYQITSLNSQRQSSRYSQAHNKQRTSFTSSKRRSSKLVSALIAVGIIVLLSLIFGEKKSRSVNNSVTFSSFPSSYSQNFSCTGKIYCSEMTSCAEATFYLQNCPGVKIDGDGDGIPCEDQLCGH